MFAVITPANEMIMANTLAEAITIKGREYNLYLCGMFERDSSINPVRENTDMYSSVIDDGEKLEWKVKEEIM